MLKHRVAHITARHWRKEDDEGFIANRLLNGVPPSTENIQLWLTDLRYLVKRAWDTGPEGAYVSSVRERAAAAKLQALLHELDAAGFVERIEKERRLA